MKVSSLKEKSIQELNSEVAALKQELFDLRFAHATHQLENTASLREVKRNIARVKTVLRQREIEAAKNNA